MRRGDRGRERALRTAIGSIVEREAPGRSIHGLRVTPSRYASSARLSVIDVDLDDGNTFHLVLKECGRRDRLPGAPALAARFIHRPGSRDRCV